MKLSKDERQYYLPVEPEYCTQCGDVMVKGPLKKWVASYDRKTGKYDGSTEHWLRCRKQATFWQRLIHWGYHEEFLVIDHPHGYTPYDEGRPSRSILTTIRTF